ncbi:MAG TPA: hypothetical protein VJ203_08535 [Bacteroidales bacterium]|nr:hypothetical protein [Bacteroidales bacterium]
MNDITIMPRVLFIITTVLLCSSCGEKIFTGDVDCSECYQEKPEFADLIINVSINDSFAEVPLVIYRGDVENGQIEYADTAYKSPYYHYVPVDKKYSVRADYKKANKTLYAIDGTKLKVLLVTEACDQECYVIENEVINVEISKAFQDF